MSSEIIVQCYIYIIIIKKRKKILYDFRKTSYFPEIIIRNRDHDTMGSIVNKIYTDFIYALFQNFTVQPNHSQFTRKANKVIKSHRSNH